MDDGITSTLGHFPPEPIPYVQEYGAWVIHSSGMEGMSVDSG